MIEIFEVNGCKAIFSRQMQIYVESKFQVHCSSLNIVQGQHISGKTFWETHSLVMQTDFVFHLSLLLYGLFSL